MIEDREYNDRDFDRNLILEQRTEVVAAKITEFLKSTDRFSKSIVFCENIEHAERMRQAMVNANPDLAAANSKYVMRITGDNDEGKAQLDNFIDPESVYPVIAVTSRLMSTGVDAQTCKLIVLDRRINSMTECKQIIYVNNVPVAVVTERVQYIDENGKLITESLKDYSRRNVCAAFASLDDFLTAWNHADRKAAILDELAAKGVFLDELAAEVGHDYDAFDLICHVAFDQPPLTRRSGRRK